MDYYQHIIIKFGGGTYVRSLRKIGVGLLVLTLAVGVSLLGQWYANTFAANTLPGNNEIITIGGTTDGQPVNAAVSASAYSDDGNVILFTSNATNLPNAGGAGGLYTYNIRADTTHRVDISTNGTQPNGGLWNTRKMSETGRYVTFGSLATNLIDGSSQQIAQYYKHDTQTGITTYIGNHYSSGLGQNWDRNLGISNDGQSILFASRYWANSYPNNYGVVVGQETSGTYNWTSLGIDNNGGQGSSSSSAVVGDISCDGAFAAFQKDYTIRLADLRRGTATTISLGNDETSPVISCNGRYILYATTNRTDITPTPTGMDSYLHLVRYDRITGQRIYVDSDSSGVFSTAHFSYNHLSEPPANAFFASIADTGDVVFYYNGATYLKHLSDGSGTLESIARTASGTYININTGTITSDGRYIFFQSDPYDLGLAPSATSAQLIRTKTGL